MVIFGIWAYAQRRSDAARFTVLFASVAFVSHFVQKIGDGVYDNAQFELILATAVGLGLAYANAAALPAMFGRDVERRRIVIVLILIARLVLSARMMPYLLLVSPQLHADIRERSALVTREIARIAAIPGPVICGAPNICRMAGKSYLYDDFYVRQLIGTGKRSRAEVDRQVQALGARWEHIDPRTGANWR
jgi:hypothetical protein